MCIVVTAETALPAPEAGIWPRSLSPTLRTATVKRRPSYHSQNRAEPAPAPRPPGCPDPASDPLLICVGPGPRARHWRGQGLPLTIPTTLAERHPHPHDGCPALTLTFHTNPCNSPGVSAPVPASVPHFPSKPQTAPDRHQEWRTVETLMQQTLTHPSLDGKPPGPALTVSWPHALAPRPAPADQTLLVHLPPQGHLSKKSPVTPPSL